MKPLLFLALVAAASDSFSQEAEAGEKFFHQAGIAVRLLGADSLAVTVGAGSEDLQNTVGVFPYLDKDKPPFRLLEQRLEAYFQERIPVLVDGKRVYLRVVQWKPGGAGRKDGLDSSDLHVDDLFVTLGGKLPPRPRKHLDITMNMWLEREDAGETVVQFSLFQDRHSLRRLWTGREKKVRFPLHADSLAWMKANPPPPLRKLPGVPSTGLTLD